MLQKVSMMAAFAAGLEEKMQKDQRIRVLTADLVGSCALKGIEQTHPEQFINVGIAEQNMVGIAAGLAREGLLPYTYTFSAFHSMRACEQVRTDVFYNGLNVKMIGTHCGVSTGQAGSTHFSLEDVGILRSMPGSVILVPSDPVSAGKTADVVYRYPSGVYVRLDRNPLPPLYPDKEPFEIGKAHVLRDGTDAALFAMGAAVHAALEAAEQIGQKSGKSCAVIDVYSVKPLDKECFLAFAGRCRHLFLIEEHNICAGLFGAAAECIAQEERSCLLHPVGIPEIYPHGNTLDRARELLGLSADRIERTVLEKMK